MRGGNRGIGGIGGGGGCLDGDVGDEMGFRSFFWTSDRNLKRFLGFSPHLFVEFNKEWVEDNILRIMMGF